MSTSMHTITFMERQKGKWQIVDTEDYAFGQDARKRFTSAIATCAHTSTDVKVIWRKNAMGAKTMGTFFIKGLN